MISLTWWLSQIQAEIEMTETINWRIESEKGPLEGLWSLSNMKTYMSMNTCESQIVLLMEL